MKSFIALVMYCVGVKPSVTSFIDGETLSYGYGKMNGWIGIWEYQIENRWALKRLNSKHKAML